MYIITFFVTPMTRDIILEINIMVDGAGKSKSLLSVFEKSTMEGIYQLCCVTSSKRHQDPYNHHTCKRKASRSWPDPSTKSQYPAGKQLQS